MVSVKEESLDKSIEKRLQGLPLQAYQWLKADQELRYLQEYANSVSIGRLGFNDHGPVHMRMVTLNAIRISQIIQEAGEALSLQKEELGTWEDSLVAVVVACFLHDTGMSVGRKNHEETGIWLTMRKIEEVLLAIYPKNLEKRVILRSMIVEGIIGHMATVPIHSREAGLVLVADGCDMEKGRSRIPMLIKKQSREGDIHQYSAAAIDKVWVEKGQERIVKIRVMMSESAGFHQIEEVLIHKLKASPIKSWVEIEGVVNGSESHWYRP
jgi:metal-dependent HD superfamily phosphatase/phosphodiesterase